MGTRRYLVYTDTLTKGKGHQGPSIIAGIIINPEGERIDQFSISLSHATVYEAKYIALVHSINKAIEHGAKAIGAFTSSELIVNQINHKSRITKPHLKRYVASLRDLKSSVKHLDFVVIPAHLNQHTNNLILREVKRNETK